MDCLRQEGTAHLTYFTQTVPPTAAPAPIRRYNKSRALRPRSSRPGDSAAALDIGGEDDARIRSGSVEDILTPDGEEADKDGLEDDAETLAASGRPVKPLPKSKGKARAKSPQTRAPQTGSHTGPSLPRGSSNGIHSLPTVGIHHRHCAVPLYFPVERVERLTHPEKRVAPPRTTPTNNLAFNQTAQDRVHRAGDAMLAPSSSGGLWGDRPRCKEAIEVS
ncbi:hypothetical protein FIBSPDRAFT_968231 [Athelia psychrophila]|uniref:Uncharacterized protein n=1 Tax=Athelia psychrophila TaxID=1759441 RepID=A0A167UV87_9AGAM|nr:hypothetical protein FIBSPDRAFT_968231 [Fibularhizoctonia sp. CBS 109695]